MAEIRLLMVDDHNLFRESLGRVLESTDDFRVVGQCRTIAETLQALTELQPDIVLLDYDLGAENGIDLLRDIRESHREVRVLMVTAGLSDELMLRVMESGASGIFLKHNSPDQLLTAIRQVAAGEIWLDQAALQSLLAGSRTRAEASELSRPLTARQRNVLRGILDGLANKEIAGRLKVSESAVKAAIQELFQKAGVRTRSQLVRIAIEKHSADWLNYPPEN